MYIQYMVLGYKPMTFRTWVSTQNHWTRAPTQQAAYFVRFCYVIKLNSSAIHFLLYINIIFLQNIVLYNKRNVQCDQTERFLKLFCYKFSNKSCPNILWLFWITLLFKSNCCGYFWGNFRKKLSYIYSNIWSHWVVSFWSYRRFSRSHFVPASEKDVGQ